MYKKFFGLKELPFRNNLDSNFFYEKASRLEILNALTYIIKRGDAVIKVTGEVGSGKTTLLRLVAFAISDSTELVYINAPNLSPKDLLYSIANEPYISKKQKVVESHTLVKNKVSSKPERQILNADDTAIKQTLKDVQTINTPQ